MGFDTIEINLVWLKWFFFSIFEILYLIIPNSKLTLKFLWKRNWSWPKIFSDQNIFFGSIFFWLKPFSTKTCLDQMELKIHKIMPLQPQSLWKIMIHAFVEI